MTQVAYLVDANPNQLYLVTAQTLFQKMDWFEMSNMQIFSTKISAELETSLTPTKLDTRDQAPLPCTHIQTVLAALFQVNMVWK